MPSWVLRTPRRRVRRPFVLSKPAGGAGQTIAVAPVTASESAQGILRAGEITIPVGRASHSAQAFPLQNRPNLAFPFTVGDGTTITIPGPVHGIGHAALLVHVYHASGGLLWKMQPGDISVHQSTYDVVVSLNTPLEGQIVIAGAQDTSPGGGNVRHPFAGQTSVTVPGTMHNFHTTALLVTVQTDGTPAYEVEPESVSIDPATQNVTVAFNTARTGTVVVAGRSVAGTPANVTHPFSTATVTIPGATHGLATRNLVLQVYDMAVPAHVVQPESWSVHPTTFDVTIEFNTAQSRTAVLHGSQRSGIATVAQVSETLTAQAIRWAPKHRLLVGVSEQATGQAITRNPRHFLVGQLTEQGTGHGVTRVHGHTLPQLITTETVQGVSRPFNLLLALPSEQATAQPLIDVKATVLGQASSSHLAQTLIAPAARLLVGVSASHTAQGIAVNPFARLVTSTSETALSQGILARPLFRLAAQVMEQALGHAIAWSPRSRFVAHAFTQEIAQTAAWSPRLRFVAQVSEQALGQAVTWSSKSRLVTQTSEQALVQLVAWSPRHRLVSQVSEQALGQAVTRNPFVRLLLQTQSAETSQAAQLATIRLILHSVAQESGQPTVWAPRHRFVTQVLSGHLSRDISLPTSTLVGTTSESALAQGLGREKRTTVPLAVASEVVEAITRVRFRELVLVTVGHLAHAPVVLKTQAVLQVSMAQSAQAILGAGRTRLLGIGTAQESTQPVAWNPRTRLITFAHEATSVQGVTWNPRTRLVGMATLQELSQGILWAPRTRLVGTGLAQETSQTVLWNPRTRLVVLTSETATSQSVLWRPRDRFVTQVVERDTTEVILRPGGALVAPVLTQELAQGTRWAPRTRLLVFAVAQDQGQPLSVVQTRLLGIVLAQEQTASVSAPIIRLMHGTFTQETTQDVRISPLVRLLSSAVTQDSSTNVLWRPRDRFVAVAIDGERVEVLILPGGGLVGQVLASHAAQPIFWAPKERLVSIVTEQPQALVIGVNPLARLLSAALTEEVSESLIAPNAVLVQAVLTQQSAQSIVWSPRDRFVAVVTAFEQAPAMAASLIEVVGTSTEAGQGHGMLTNPHFRFIPLVSDTSTASPVLWVVQRLVGRVSAQERVEELVRPGARLVSAVSAAHSSQDIRWRPQARFVAPVVTMDEARIAGAMGIRLVLPCTEQGSVQGMLEQPRTRLIVPATSTEAPLILGIEKRLGLVTGVMTDAALDFLVRHQYPLGSVSELLEALLVQWAPQARFVAAVSEQEIAQIVGILANILYGEIFGQWSTEPVVSGGWRTGSTLTTV